MNTGVGPGSHSISILPPPLISHTVSVNVKQHSTNNNHRCPSPQQMMVVMSVQRAVLGLKPHGDAFGDAIPSETQRYVLTYFRPREESMSVAFFMRPNNGMAVSVWKF